MKTPCPPLLPSLLLVSSIFLQCLQAEDLSADSSAVSLEKVEVVATPVASQPTLDGFAVSTTHIGGDQLDDLKALDLASALRRTPGVSISRFNQVGAFGGTEGGAIFLRGLGSSRPGGEIKTLVNGVPKLNGVFNHPLLDLMSVDLADHIEVSTHAAPTSLGNAFGAVEVTTPRLDKQGSLLRTEAAAGSFGTVIERLDYGRKEGDFDTYFSQSHRRSDGERPDSDGRLDNYFLHLGWAFARVWDLSYEVDRTDNRATDPGLTTPQAGVASTKGETYETSDWLHIATLSHKYQKAEGFIRGYLNDGEGNWTRRQYSGNADSLNDWRLYGLRLRETLRPWEGGEALFGGDLDFDRGTTRSVPLAGLEGTFGPATMRVFSPYVGLSQTLVLGERATLTPSLGFRHYDHNELASKEAPQAGLVFQSGANRVHASFGRAVNYPGVEVRALSGLSIPALGQSWRSLRPEQVDQYELGVQHSFRPGTAVSLVFFRNEASERYVIAFPPPPPPRYVNLESYRTQGVELTAESSVTGNLALFGGISLMETTPDDVPYAPKTSTTGGLNWRFAPGWKLSVDASYGARMKVASQARTAGAANLVGVGAQFLLNARLSRHLRFGSSATRSAELYLSAENLTDRNFSYTPGYPIPGLNGLFGVKVTW
jgi:iron complex outermembrane receptor protein